MKHTAEQRLKRSHVALMKHPETALYSGIILMGKSTIDDNVPTAYTDGVNKVYGREFVDKLNDEELRALILHENLHVALKHMSRFMKEFKAEPQLINASADYVVNDIIVNLQDRYFCKLPDGGLVDSKYHNWSVRQVYNDLKQKQDNDPDFQPQDSLDKHGFGEGECGNMTPQEQKKLSEKIDKALRQGSLLAGKLGGKTPQAIEDLLTGKVDWRAVLREFITSNTRGMEELSWRNYSKKHIPNDIYLPSAISEKMEELVIGWDTSGSIGNQANAEFAGELKLICENVNPSKVRILWWDTEVTGEQVFTEGNYEGMDKVLKPRGGGGTDPNCIPKYIKDKNINASAMVVFTDGYFYGDVDWSTDISTLWLVTENDRLEVPKGKIVKQYL